MATINPAAATAAFPDDDYARTGPGTPAGNYLRRFWQPVYHSVDIVAGRAVLIRIMGEAFTLYRGETSGRAYLTQDRCPHRGTLLSAGWVEDDCIRCFYHGWKFDDAGQCVDQPAEESEFAHKVRIRSYPTEEALGLVFAYLGDGDPPPFPRYPEFENFEGVVEVDSYSRDCNYFQNVENALDMSHVGFVHGDNRAAFRGIGLGRSLEAAESSWGVTYCFTRNDGEKRIQQLGMPNIFHMTALPTDPDIGWQESLFWWVPVDDGHHMQFSVHRVPVTGAAAERIHERRQRRRTEIDIAHQDACREILAGRKTFADYDPARVDMIRLQDDVAQLGQGVIADRNNERPGRGDIGVIAIRKLWRREMDILARGGEIKRWERSPGLVPSAWGLSGTPASFKPRGAAQQADVRAEIMDVRPFVAIDRQLRLLNGTDDA